MPEEMTFGVYTLRRYSDGTLWIEHESGEGMSVDETEIERLLHAYFGETF